MAESKVSIRRPNSANTPPNCAICLGHCTNKCFSDSCMHQFCFQCLLEWSRIKAECPLCKQPFKSIIHNVKSNEEYEEHIVEAPRNEEVRLLGNDDNMWFLPLPLTPHRHEFHVRTTFTVDSRGEHAIQQMLLTHPLTAGGRITVGTTGYPSSRGVYPSRHRRDFSATSFRRSIYAQNLWVYAQPDLTGRYRECSPTFFRDNPASRQRLAPWLNRELNALLYENTQLIMHLVDLIMDHLLRHHICSRTFRNLLREYFDAKTDHFVHEFYNFMRSPYDMIGYDRSVIYTSRPQSPAPILEDDTVEIPDDNSDDSDVVLVSASNPTEPVTISLIESNSDSDEPVMVSSSSQVPMPLPPPVPRCVTPEFLTRPSSPVTLVNLPPKLRHKHKALQEKEKYSRWIKKRHHRSRSSSSSSSSTSDEREKESYKKYKRRKLMKKLKQKKVSSHIDSTDSNTEVNITSGDSETDDNKPLIEIIKQKRKEKSKKSRKDRKRKASRHEDLFRVREQPRLENPTQIFPMDLTLEAPSCSRYPGGSSSLSNSRYHIELPQTRSTVELSNNGQYTSVQIETSSGLADNNYEPSSSKTKIRIVRNGHNSPLHRRESHDRDESVSSGSSTEPYRIPTVKSEIREIKQENPGPSTSRPIPLVLKREHNKWYVFGESDSSD